LRIAVYENLPPGGALRTSYELGAGLVRRGHEIDLYRLSTYADKGAFDLAAAAASVTIKPYRPMFGVLNERLRSGHLAPRSYTLFVPLKRLHRALASEIDHKGYDIVLVHPDAMTFAPYVLRWLRTPTLYYCQEPPRVAFERDVREKHNANLLSSPHGIGFARVIEDKIVLDRLIAEDVTTAICPTLIAVNSVFSRERAWAAYARNAEVCYLGVDADRFSPPTIDTPKRREVLSIGAPIAAKNHGIIVEALALLPPDSRPTLRIVLPRSDVADDLTETARRRGVELLIESGIDEAALIDRYRAALATVCAARLEPFGLTAIESMACGTPVIAIREGGFRESVIDGETGLLVDPAREHIAEAIRSVVDDPSRAMRMGAAARAHVVQQWTWSRSVDRIEALLDEAVRA
jgi:glycosyltransferase involved in cell wall biosynthesis